MLKEEDLPPQLRPHEAQPQPLLEAEVPVAPPVEAPPAELPENLPPDPYLRTS